MFQLATPALETWEIVFGVNNRLMQCLIANGKNKWILKCERTYGFFEIFYSCEVQ
jgi:hypothetical protein